MRRITELDSLRGLAAVAIVLFHLWLPTLAFLGTAVDLFFVMSGYLITDIILKQGHQPGFLANFYARRALRIWPIYYLSLLFLLAVNPFLPVPFPTDALPYFLTYTQNSAHYWGQSNPAFFDSFAHTWTLAVEEQYYLVWPLALIVLGRRSLRPLALVFIAVAVGTRMTGFSRWTLMSRSDGLAIGGLLASLLNCEVSTVANRVGIGRLLAGLGVGSVVFLARKNGWGDMINPSWPSTVALSLRMLAINLLFCSVIGLIVLNHGHKILAPLRNARLAMLGQLSYGIYLYHYFLFEIIQQYADRFELANGLTLDLFKLTVSFLVALASWRWIEQPLLSLKGRFTYQAKTQVNSMARTDSVRLDSLGSRMP